MYMTYKGTKKNNDTQSARVEKKMLEITKKEIVLLQEILAKRGFVLKESILLDIGGGIGRMAYPLSILAKKVIMVENFPNDFQQARELYEKVEHGDLTIKQEGFLDLSLDENSVDIAVSFNDPFNYLLTTEEQIKALENIRRVLNPGGLVLIDIQNFYSTTKNYHLPEMMSWEDETFKQSSFISYEIQPIKGIWKQKEHLYKENLETGEIEHIENIKTLKMISPSEMHLLLKQTEFETIESFPGVDICESDDTRIWVVAQKRV